MKIRLMVPAGPLTSRLPLLEATALVERKAAPELVTPMAPNPIYQGIPWLVPGPVAGAPYYV